MKKQISLALTAVMLFMCFGLTAYAENTNEIPMQFGVIVQDGLAVALPDTGSSVMLNSDVLVLGGHIQLKDRSCLSASNKLYYREGVTVSSYDMGAGITKPSNYCRWLQGDFDIQTAEPPRFDESSLTMYEPVTVSNEDTVISENCYIPSVTLSKTGNLVFDTEEGQTLYIKIDTLDFASSISSYDKGTVNVQGGGNVVLLLGNMTGSKTKNINYPSNVNVDWKNYPKQDNHLVVIYENTEKQPITQLRMQGDLYFTDSVETAGIFNIIGNVICDGDLLYTGKLNEKGSSEEFNVLGQICAPHGLVHTTGAARIRGMVYARQAELLGNTIVVYEDGNYVTVYANDNVRVPETNPDINIGENITPDYNVPTPAPKPTSTPEMTDELVPDNAVTGEEKDITTNYAYLYGYSDTVMAPDESLTRGQAAAMIYRVLYQENRKQSVAMPAVPTYADLDSGHWQYAGLEYMTAIGVYNGKASTRISPDLAVPRGEVAKMIAFSLGLQPSGEELGFSDIQPGDHYYQYIDALVSHGYLNGYDGQIHADDGMTRAEFVAMFNRIIGRDASSYQLVYSDGTEAVNSYNDIEDHWAYTDLMLASHSFNQDNQVDDSLKMDRNEIDFAY